MSAESYADQVGLLIGVMPDNARERRFLTSFHQVGPDRTAIGFEPAIAELPAVRWKLLNVERLQREYPAKFAEQLRSLETCLDRD
ncbi:hypothetical protein [Sphingomonas crusticola]|uniref:hypothetical protein n=1 Tax=Sphingomonas crusticola TaxID=1697973 RepID=UPI000E222130|nr:hypothetical protein [Sphingomonas crusticola]